jgi:preprotein translocase subunit SecG
MIAPDDNKIVKSKGEPQMKKLMTAMLALSFLVATVGVSFAQETKKEDSTMKKKGGKKGSKKKEDTEKKGGSL